MAGISGKTIGRGSRKRLPTSNIRINGQVLNKKSDAQKSKILTATRALAAMAWLRLLHSLQKQRHR